MLTTQAGLPAHHSPTAMYLIANVDDGTVTTTRDERAGFLETRDDAGARRPALRWCWIACAAILGPSTAPPRPGCYVWNRPRWRAPGGTAVNDDPLAGNDLFHGAGVYFAASHEGRYRKPR